MSWLDEPGIPDAKRRAEIQVELAKRIVRLSRDSSERFERDLNESVEQFRVGNLPEGIDDDERTEVKAG